MWGKDFVGGTTRLPKKENLYNLFCFSHARENSRRKSIVKWIVEWIVKWIVMIVV